MSVKINKTRLVIRNDLASNWASKNPILLKGEMGFERDTRKFKLGDGVTNWNNLLYVNITDLENHYTKEEIEQLIQAEEDRASIVEQGLDGRVNQVETQITEAENLINEVKEQVDNMVVEETDPTVPAWAKQPNKPEYTPEEIGEHGVAVLDENGKIFSEQIPNYLLKGLVYGGSLVCGYGLGFVNITKSVQDKFKIENTSLSLTNDTNELTGYVAHEGIYYICVRGNSNSTQFAGITFEIGDILISTGTQWTKIDNTDDVVGVKGENETTYRKGQVNITKENIGLGKVLNIESYSKEEINELINNIPGDATILDVDELPKGIFINGQKVSTNTANAFSKIYFNTTYTPEQFKDLLNKFDSFHLNYAYGDGGYFKYSYFLYISNNSSYISNAASYEINGEEIPFCIIYLCIYRGAHFIYSENSSRLSSIAELNKKQIIWCDENFKNNMTELNLSRSGWFPAFDEEALMANIKVSYKSIKTLTYRESETSSINELSELMKDIVSSTEFDLDYSAVNTNIFYRLPDDNIYFYNGEEFVNIVARKIDDSPKQNSENLITSGGVKEAIDESLEYTDTKSSQTLSSAKSYTDIAKAAAKSYTDSEISKINVSGGGGSSSGSGSGGGIVDIDKLPQLPIILEGTPIPSETNTVVEKVYVNTVNLMSNEELKEKIIDLGIKTGENVDSNGFIRVWYTLYYLSNSDYSISKFLTVVGFSTENGDDFNGYYISFDEEINETEEYISHIIWCDEAFYNGCISAGWEGMVMEGPGWNLQNIPDGFIECGGPGEFTISQSCTAGHGNILNMGVDEFQAYVNDLFKDLFSATPYVIQPNPGTSLPIDGTPINEIYFNFDATDEDIIPILVKMNTEFYPDDYINDGSFMGGHVAELTNNSLSLYLYNNQYYIIGPNNSAFRTTINNIDGSGVIWASKGCNEVNSSIVDGWNPEFVEYAKNGYFPSDEYARGTTVSNYFIPLLSPIISSTPIEKQIELDEKSIYRTPEKRYYNKNGYEYIEFATNKDPQTIQEVESLPGKTVKSGTALPNNSPINKIYFNFNAADEDIIPILDKMDPSQWDGSFMGGHYVRLFQNAPLTLTSTVTSLSIDGAPDMFYTIGFESGGRPENVSGEEIIWASKGCNMVNSSIIDGWNPEFVEYAKNGFDLGDTLSTSNSNITTWVELIKDIISSTPFEEKFIPDDDVNSKIIYKTPDGKLHNLNGDKFLQISTSEDPIAIKEVKELPEAEIIDDSVEAGGFVGTELPTNGSIPSQIHFNLEATDEDIIPILKELNPNVGSGKYDNQYMNSHSVTLVDNITDFDFDTDYSIEAIVIHWYPIGSDQTNGHYFITLSGVSGGSPNYDAYVIWASKGYAQDEPSSGIKDGWQDWVIEANGIFNIGGSNFTLTDNARYFIPLLKDVISSTPFEVSYKSNPDLNQSTIYRTPDDKYHNYNGKKYIELSTSENPMAVKEVEELPEAEIIDNSIGASGFVGTVLPTDNSIIKSIYLNYNATDEDIIPIFEKIYNENLFEHQSNYWRYTQLFSNIPMIVIEYKYNGTKYYCIGLNNDGLNDVIANIDGNDIIWASKGCHSDANFTITDGWNPSFVKDFPDGLLVGYEDSVMDSATGAKGIVPLLKDIISSTPFEASYKSNPDFSEQPIYKTFPSKYIINPENGFIMYFNGEDVSVRMSDFSGNEANARFYIEKDFPTENIKPEWVDEENGNPGIANSYLIDDKIYCAWQDDNGEWVFDLIDTFFDNVFGTSQYKIVDSLDKATESDILYVVVPSENYVFGNPKYFILDKTTGHKLELGSGIKTVEELPYFTNEGTAVPETGLVEKVYFNTKMNPVDVVKILDTLEYYDLSDFGFSIPSAVVCVSDDLSTVIIIGNFSDADSKSYSIAYQSSEGNKIIYDYDENSSLDVWYDIENIDVNVENALGVLGAQFGVSNQNDKVKNIISITPFENWDNINDETIYKVQKQTDGEYEKPKYVLLDKNTKTKTELGGGSSSSGSNTLVLSSSMVSFENEGTDSDPLWVTTLDNEIKENELYVISLTGVIPSLFNGSEIHIFNYTNFLKYPSSVFGVATIALTLDVIIQIVFLTSKRLTIQCGTEFVNISDFKIYKLPFTLPS